MKKDNIIWITKNGVHIPITTNQYMNRKIKEAREEGKEYELYHGSNADFNEFDDNYIGTASLGGLTYGKGHYFFIDDKYIYTKKKYKIKAKLNKPFIAQETQWANELRTVGYNLNDRSILDPSDYLSQLGYDSTIIKNDDKIAEIIIFTNKDKKIKIISKEDNY